MNAFVAPWLQLNPLSFVEAAKSGAEIGNAAHTALLQHQATMSQIAAEGARAAAELQMAKNYHEQMLGVQNARLGQGQERLNQGQERIGSLEGYRSGTLDARNRGLDINQQNADTSEARANKPAGSAASRLIQALTGGVPTSNTATNSDTADAPMPTDSSGAVVNLPYAVPSGTPPTAAQALFQGPATIGTATNPSDALSLLGGNALNNGSPYFSNGAAPSAAAALTGAPRQPMINGVPVDQHGNPISSSAAPSVYGTYNPATGTIDRAQQ